MTFKKWYSLNKDILEEQYESYIESLSEHNTCMTFDAFVQDKWDCFDEYIEREERE